MKQLIDEEKYVVLDEEYLNKFDEIVVIGDIHGCCDEFNELLDKVHSESPSKDPHRCLKILVGDLVNKGPKNEEVLKVCSDTYPDSIIAVRGNHDEIVSNYYLAFKSDRNFISYPKNKWVETLPERYVNYLHQLPYTISIPSLSSIIVHAGLQPNLKNPAKDTPTNLMITMRNIVVSDNEDKSDCGSFLRCTKSEKEGVAWASFWSGPEHVYFGHDARRRLQDKHKFATGLDTGCVYGDRLSYIYIKGPRKGELSSIKAKTVYEATNDSEPIRL